MASNSKRKDGTSGDAAKTPAAICRNGPGETVTLDPRSVRMAFEIRGVGNLSEMVYASAASSGTMHLKRILQDARKCTKRGKRQRTTVPDLHRAISRHDTKYIPFVPDMESEARQATVGGKSFYYEEDREVEVSSLLTKELEKVPVEVTLRNHWLVIDGRQPTVPENPAPESMEEQTEKSLNPANTRLPSFQSHTAAETNKKFDRPKSLWEVLGDRSSHNGDKCISAARHSSGPELAIFKEVKNHELSVEQQVFYREITEACVGSSEEKRIQALTSLATDSGLHQILPRLITFIVEGIRVNTVQSNLALLIYLVRMQKALLENNHLYLDKYLHEIVPACITCITCKQLCLRPESDNHWALRDFAAKQLSIIVQKYTNPSYQIGPRVCMVLSLPLQNPNRAPLGTLYGAITAMCELGADVVRTSLIPSLQPVCGRLTDLMTAIEEVDRVQAGIQPGMLGDRISQISTVDRRAVEQIQTVLLGRLPPILKNYSLTTGEEQSDYCDVFGSIIGPKMFNAVLAARQQPNKQGPQVSGITCLKPRRRTRAVTSQNFSNTPATTPAASSNLKQMRLAAVSKSEPNSETRSPIISGQRRMIMVKEEGAGHPGM